MLDRLEKAFAAQHQIVQDISHELKTPLTILRGQLEVALKRPRAPEYYEALIRENLSEIARMRTRACQSEHGGRGVAPQPIQKIRTLTGVHHTKALKSIPCHNGIVFRRL